MLIVYHVDLQKEPSECLDEYNLPYLSGFRINISFNLPITLHDTKQNRKYYIVFSSSNYFQLTNIGLENKQPAFGDV